MKTTISTKWFLLPLIFSLGATLPVEATKRPFKAPSGTSVSYYSSGKDYAGWTIMSNDNSATAVVAKIKLPKAYGKGKAFERYVKRYFKNDQTFASYGVNVRVRWKNGAYTISGTSNGYRVYAKGRLAKNRLWTQGWVVGPRGTAGTKSLETMIKRLQ
jgi:hypothetical protein